MMLSISMNLPNDHAQNTEIVNMMMSRENLSLSDLLEEKSMT